MREKRREEKRREEREREREREREICIKTGQRQAKIDLQKQIGRQKGRDRHTETSGVWQRQTYTDMQTEPGRDRYTASWRETEID